MITLIKIRKFSSGIITRDERVCALCFKSESGDANPLLCFVRFLIWPRGGLKVTLIQWAMKGVGFDCLLVGLRKHWTRATCETDESVVAMWMVGWWCCSVEQFVLRELSICAWIGNVLREFCLVLYVAGWYRRCDRHRCVCATVGCGATHYLSDGCVLLIY